MNLEPNVKYINVEDIIPNRFQPRLTFDENALKELAMSIKEHGIIQPITVRQRGENYEHRLICTRIVIIISLLQYWLYSFLYQQTHQSKQYVPSNTLLLSLLCKVQLLLCKITFLKSFCK